MLDQYHEQGMFGAPMPLPKRANVFRMLWIFLLKLDGTKKSRMVCDGNPAMRQHLNIGQFASPQGGTYRRESIFPHHMLP